MSFQELGFLKLVHLEHVILKPGTQIGNGGHGLEYILQKVIWTVCVYG